MQGRITELRERCLGQIPEIQSAQELEILRTRVLGKKGELTQLLKHLGELSAADRPAVGKLLNEVKALLEVHFAQRTREIRTRELEEQLQRERVDVTLPGRSPWLGHRHPLSITLERILQIFGDLGFDIALGPDIETDFHNFQALNIPKDHPARDMQDTFWLADDWLLRTHTSPVQIRTMLKEPMPIRIVAPGAVYRCDSDLTHSPMFHQVEGLMVDEEISMSDLKGILTIFLERLFEKTRVRFRPSFFPFTEPSTEVDIECVLCKGKGCGVCKQSGWLEILGAGLVDPEVFRAVHYPLDASGFAFGIGVERVAMLTYGIDNIRHFYRSDLRFLDQF